MTKSRLLDLLKLFVAVGLLTWLVMKLPDPAALWWQIVHANKPLLLLGAACYTLAVAVSALKWGVLLHAAGIDLPRSRLLAYQWMAEFFNNFLPAQVGGDVMRGYAVAVDTRRKADAAASVVIDRFIGLMIFMLFAAIFSNAVLLWGKPDGQPFSPEGALFMRFAAIGSAAAALALLAVVATLLSRRLKRLMERLLAVLPFSASHAAALGEAGRRFRCLPRPPGRAVVDRRRQHAIVLLTSINIWLIAQGDPAGEHLAARGARDQPDHRLCANRGAAFARWAGRASNLFCRAVSLYGRRIRTRHRGRLDAAVHRLPREHPRRHPLGAQWA
jgi:uncharacterized membrane protein YbhN (UPF0104 family)